MPPSVLPISQCAWEALERWISAYGPGLSNLRGPIVPGLPTWDSPATPWCDYGDAHERVWPLPFGLWQNLIRDYTHGGYPQFRFTVSSSPIIRTFGIILALFTGPFLNPSDALGQVEQAGVVVGTRGDEQLRRAGSERWQEIAVNQTVLPGDQMRTGRYGGVNILLSDETQLRVHRRSEVSIRSVRGEGRSEPSMLSLFSGSVWSRARSLFRSITGNLSRSRSHSVSLQTPTATIGIRGTDWHVQVDESGQTHLTVIHGDGEISNEHGRVKVGTGEKGFTHAEGGLPRSKRILDLKDRPLIALDLEHDWKDLLRLTDGTINGHIERFNVIDDVSKAFVAYDLGRFDKLRAWISRGDFSGPKVNLLTAMLDIRERRYERAARKLQAVRHELSGSEVVVATLAGIGIDVQRGYFASAESGMHRAVARYPDRPDVADFQIWLTAHRGEHKRAADMAKAAAQRFPTDARFHVHAAQLAFMLDDGASMHQAIRSAHNLDLAHHGAWHAKGLYLHYVEPDGEAALRAYRRAVTSHASYASAWNNLGLVAFDLGRHKEAKHALEMAIKADPGGATARANLGSVLTFLNRLDDAEAMFNAALAAEPNEPYAELGLAYLEMLRGEPNGGIDRALRASTAHPHLPRVSSALGAAYYQNLRFESAEASLSDARRIDPNDPVPDLLGAILASDRFLAGEAIRRGRDGFDKAIRARSIAVENFANAKSGSATLGAAFTNLGLHDWGGFYTQLAFDPYLANGYFYLASANQLDSEDARLGASVQGLLLDPTAVSSPTRYYEPFSRPRLDITTSLQVGANGAPFHGGAVSFEGFGRSPDPVAWFTDLSYRREDGFRPNSDITDMRLLAGVGSSLGERKHNLLFILDALDRDAGRPGVGLIADADDRINTRFGFASVGYQYRFDFDNRFIAHFVAGTETFGVAAPNNGTDELGADCDPLCDSRVKQDDRIGQLQVRHLFSWHGLDLTYGAEAFFDRFTQSSRVIEPGLGAFLDGERRRIAARQAYVQGRYDVTPRLSAEAGAYVRDLETGLIFKSHLDARIGLAWRPTNRHWLRAAFQQKLVFPQRAAQTIAPVDTVGLVVPDQFFAGFEGGERVNDYRARWEAEWTPRLFNYAELSRQNIRDYGDETRSISHAQIDQLRVGANIWLMDNIGLALRGELRQSADAATGLDIPGIADHTFEATLTWISPRQIVASVGLGYVGQRFDDIDNMSRLKGYWTSSAFVRWESPMRHWAIDVGANDLLDEAAGLSSSAVVPGRSMFARLEYRH